MRPRAAVAFYCILLGLVASITLSTAFSGTSNLASRTDDLFLPQIWPNTTEPSSRMEEIMRCTCGKTYTSEPHYTSHLNTCKRVLDENRRSWAIADSRKNKKQRVNPDRRHSQPERRSRRSETSSRADRIDRGEGTSASSTSSRHNRYESLAPDDFMVSISNLHPVRR